MRTDIPGQLVPSVLSPGQSTPLHCRGGKGTPSQQSEGRKQRLPSFSPPRISLYQAAIHTCKSLSHWLGMINEEMKIICCAYLAYKQVNALILDQQWDEIQCQNICTHCSAHLVGFYNHSNWVLLKVIVLLVNIFSLRASFVKDS